MTVRFRPQLHALEGRDIPAAFSFPLPTGGVASGQFATPAAVDADEEFQDLDIADLTVSVGAAAFGTGDFTDTPMAHYSFGELLNVAFVLAAPLPGYDSVGVGMDYAEVVVGGELFVQSVTYDGADTQATFTFPDGTVGAMSYAIPWDQVDPAQASQSLTPTSFNLNIAGQNLTLGSASFTTAPTLLFANGEFQGLSFALDTSATPGFAFTSVSMAGLNVTAIQTGTGQQFFAAADTRQAALVVDFSSYVSPANAHTLTITVKLKDGTDITESIAIPANATPGVVRNLVFSVLEDNGLKVTATGNDRLVIKGTKTSQLTQVDFDVLNPPAAWKGPKFGGQLSTPDITPQLFVNGKELK